MNCVSSCIRDLFSGTDNNEAPTVVQRIFCL